MSQLWKAHRARYQILPLVRSPDQNLAIILRYTYNQEVSNALPQVRNGSRPQRSFLPSMRFTTTRDVPPVRPLGITRSKVLPKLRSRPLPIPCAQSIATLAAKYTGAAPSPTSRCTASSSTT